jgi:hypothetical protein
MFPYVLVLFEGAAYLFRKFRLLYLTPEQAVVAA